jgi:hypothetical protein
MNSFSDKFNYFKYKPVFYSGDIESDILRCKINTHFKEEALKLNMEYFNKIRGFIESINFPRRETKKIL